jgi:hypothetical protein
VEQAIAAQFIPRRRPFDWLRDCPEEFMRQWPPVVGTGRGEVIEPFVCIRCGRESWRPFSIHRPLESDIRSCSGTVVKRSEVEAARDKEGRQMAAAMIRVARQESGWPG